MKLGKLIQVGVISLLLLFLDQNNGWCQTEPPKLAGETSKTFSELLEINQLLNFKGGLFCTAQRNDTVFAVFYHSRINNLMYFPIGRIDDALANYSYESNQESNVFRKLREPSSIISSKFALKYEENKEITYVFVQCLSNHIIDKNNKNNTEVRKVFYNKEKGVFKIEYTIKPKKRDKYFNWPYLEGDFIF